MKIDVLITVLSWEDRYILGLEKNIAEYSPSKIIVFKYNNPLTTGWKKNNLIKTKEYVGDRLLEVEIDGTKPEKNWFIFLGIFTTHCKNKMVLVDITTMTREAIWLSLYNCKLNNSNTNFIYYKPEEYADWISRDPDKPRLLYKMSGIAKLGAPTLLIITGGYDIQRLDNLIYNFEPKLTIIFLQHPNDARNKKNFNECQELCRSKYNISMFHQYDAYDIDSSYELILEKLLYSENVSTGNYIDNFNVILNSLGAKISAITLFKIWLKYPQIALSYIPSKEYNKEYSKGIGEVYTGTVPF